MRTPPLKFYRVTNRNGDVRLYARWNRALLNFHRPGGVIEKRERDGSWRVMDVKFGFRPYTRTV